MTQYWWVNHNLTARQEIGEGYLWSPKTESGTGPAAQKKRSEFYLNMRRATPGDLVLSYAGQRIRFVGRVTEFAFTAPKPEVFGDAGSYWDNEGWLLPVFWTELTPAVHPKALMATLGPMLPKKYSPIRASGDGNQKAYLAAIPREMFEAVVAQGSFDRTKLAKGGANSLSFEEVNSTLEDAIERRIGLDLTLEDTLKESVIQARRGQGQFRKNVEARERACRLTGITNPSLLIASHIKPWRVCETAQERLDGLNGLMLTPDADLLFDRGFISFDEGGEVLVSPRADREDLRRLGFERLTWERFGIGEAPAAWNTGAFVADQQRYLAYHRSDVFVS